MIECPKCRQRTLSLVEGTESVHCSNCQYTANCVEAALKYQEEVLDSRGSEETLHHCPECSSETLVDRISIIRGPSTADERYMCFTCMCFWSGVEINDCERCRNRQFEKHMVGLICEDCFRAKVDRPD